MGKPSSTLFQISLGKTCAGIPFLRSKAQLIHLRPNLPLVPFFTPQISSLMMCFKQLWVGWHLFWILTSYSKSYVLSDASYLYIHISKHIQQTSFYHFLFPNNLRKKLLPQACSLFGSFCWIIFLNKLHPAWVLRSFMIDSLNLVIVFCFSSWMTNIC